MLLFLISVGPSNIPLFEGVEEAMFEENEDLLGAASYDQREYPGNSTRQPRDDLSRRRLVLVALISIFKMVLWLCYQEAQEEGIDVSFL